MLTENVSDRFERRHPFAIAMAVSSNAQMAVGARNGERSEGEGGEGDGGGGDGGDALP